jgi:hypothetical protein
MPEPKTDRSAMFPVLESDPVLFSQLGCPRAVPWGMLEPHEAWAHQNHSQSLNRLAERGGLGAIEMYAVLNDLPYRAAEARLGLRENRTEQAVAFIVKAVAEYIEGQKRTLRERDPAAYATLHARNVDKQRRRLLAEVCQLRADSMAVVPGEAVTIARIKHGLDYWTAVDLVIAAQGKRAAKLRTIAARLRGTG